MGAYRVETFAIKASVFKVAFLRRRRLQGRDRPVAGRATLDSRGPRHQARAQAARRDASLHNLRDSLARGRRRDHDSRVFDRRCGVPARPRHPRARSRRRHRHPVQRTAADRHGVGAGLPRCADRPDVVLPRRRVRHVRSPPCPAVRDGDGHRRVGERIGTSPRSAWAPSSDARFSRATMPAADVW